MKLSWRQVILQKFIGLKNFLEERIKLLDIRLNY